MITTSVYAYFESDFFLEPKCCLALLPVGRDNEFPGSIDIIIRL